MIKLSNGALTVELSPLGGELQSIRDRAGREYLWQGDPAFWPLRAPNLFPYVGRLTEETYTLHGQPYRLPIHGFLSASPMAVVQQTPDRCALELTDSPQTRAAYPFAFCLILVYALEGRRLTVSYQVENRSAQTMYFGLGGHPGFRVPLEPGRRFEDYFLQFEPDAAPEEVVLSPDCFVTGERRPFPLADRRRLPLRHSLFDNDAVVLRSPGRRVSLCTPDGPALTMVCGNFPYLGLWHRPKTAAPYVCLEPWSSLPARKGVVEELSSQPDLLRLAAGERLERKWSVEPLL